MKKYLLRAAFGLVLLGCGGKASDTLRGGTWKISKWNYSVDSIVGPTSNMPGSTATTKATAENAGTLTFTGGQDVGSGQLARTFTQFASTGTNEATFSTVNLSDLVSWDPGGFKSEENMIIIYDGANGLWNGAWTLTGGGSEVTLSRDFGTDFGGGSSLQEHHSLVLKR